VSQAAGRLRDPASGNCLLGLWGPFSVYWELNWVVGWYADTCTHNAFTHTFADAPGWCML